MSGGEAQGFAKLGGAVTGRQSSSRAQRPRGGQALPARQREEEDNAVVVGPEKVFSD